MVTKDDGSAIEHQGAQLHRFADEFRMRLVANRVIVFLKEFPGFADWWFTINEAQRDYTHKLLRLTMLDRLGTISGTPYEKCTKLKDACIQVLDAMPGFNAWNSVVLGSSLRDRINYQLTDHMYQTFKRER
jgi:hypothetical protein